MLKVFRGVCEDCGAVTVACMPDLPEDWRCQKCDGRLQALSEEELLDRVSDGDPRQRAAAMKLLASLAAEPTPDEFVAAAEEYAALTNATVTGHRFQVGD